MKYLNLPIGEIVTDHTGVEWKRTNIRDKDSTYEDNYYYMPIKCYCGIECGGGYTYADEYGYGECAHCLNVLYQINGHNDEFAVEDFDDPALFEEKLAN